MTISTTPLIMGNISNSIVLDNDAIYFGNDLDGYIGFDASTNKLVINGGAGGIDLAGVTLTAPYYFSGTIPATFDHSAGIDFIQAVALDLGTLVTGQTYRAGYFRYNVQSTTPSNPTCEVTGLEGVAGSRINDEAITWRGGYFRTYIDTDTDPLASMRTAVGCEISARAAYAGGVEATAESGTAFVGARIWMAPHFTDASITNINNFHALWILNAAASKLVTNAIKVDTTTYGGGFQYLLYSDDGKIRTYLDGSVSGNSLNAGKTSTAAGDDLLYVVGEDLRTLTTGQSYRGAYIRYNVRSTTPSNPTCEVTGVEGCAGSYINDEAVTWRGGYFRTYINADATSSMRTAVGCEISARASYSGGTECVAEAGTAFVGARIWMAPYFTDASISNVNNSHALWIVNETPNGADWTKYIDRAITIDATTYDSGFNYCFYADSGKFYLHLDGAEAGSGLVKGERSTASGDDWMTVIADDYRTLGASQTYRAIYGRYNIRSTTISNPTDEVTGIEGVVGWYCNPTDNSTTIRGGHFRNYITAGSRVRTAVGADISSRAGLVAEDCVADAGTGFFGARIYMAPYFTAASVGNVNNFWGLWIFGEHTAQRNADAAIFISDAGGGWAEGIQVTGTFSGSQVNLLGNLVIGDDDKSVLKIGGYDNPIVNTTKQTDNAFLASFHVQSQVNPDAAEWLAATYTKVGVTTAAQGNLSIVGAMVRMDIQQAVAAAYGIQSHVKFTAGTAQDVSSEVIAISAQTYGTCAVGTGLHWGVKSDLRAVNTPTARGTSAAFFGVTTVSAGNIAYLENLSGATVQDGLYIHNVGTMTNGIYLSGTITADINSDHAIIFGNDLSIGANKLKTSALSIHEGADATYLEIWNLAETSKQNFSAAGLVVSSFLILDVNAPIQAANADGYYVPFKARDTGVNLAEVARLQGAADPYVQIGRDDTGVAHDAITDVLRIQLGTAGTATDSTTFGVGIAFWLDNGANELEQYASIDVVMTDTSNGSEDAQFDFNLISGGGENKAMSLASTGVLSVDLGGTGSAAQVDLFDGYDDALVLQQGIQKGNRELLANMGVLTRKDTGSGFMLNVQPMIRLLAGGIYQTRQVLEDLRDELTSRLEKVEKALAIS
jgi:hypothetical protein